MRKEEFFDKLEYLLQDIPDQDREDALDYYRDYLAEAGSGNEEAAIEDFGSPERVAAIIRADLAGNLNDGGSFTDRGYEDERFRDPGYQVAKRLDLPAILTMKTDTACMWGSHSVPPPACTAPLPPTPSGPGRRKWTSIWPLFSRSWIMWRRP